MVGSQFTVEYRDVPGFPGYRVGNDGSVWCNSPRGNRDIKTKGPLPWRLLRQNRTRSGHYYVALWRNGRGKTWRVHRIVLFAFRGPPPPGLICARLDGNPGNNKLDNLVWTTHKENSAHAVQHGTWAHGETHGRAVLTAERVSAIVATVRAKRDDRVNGRRYGAYTAVAKQFGVEAATVRDIMEGTTWTHTTGIKPGDLDRENMSATERVMNAELAREVVARLENVKRTPKGQYPRGVLRQVAHELRLSFRNTRDVANGHRWAHVTDIRKR